MVCDALCKTGEGRKGGCVPHIVCSSAIPNLHTRDVPLRVLAANEYSPYLERPPPRVLAHISDLFSCEF